MGAGRSGGAAGSDQLIPKVWFSFFKKIPEKREKHKVLTYVEYRDVSGVFQNIDPPPPHLLFWKTPDIKLASYSILSSGRSIVVFK